MRLCVGLGHVSSENHDDGESLSSPVNNKQPYGEHFYRPGTGAGAPSLPLTMEVPECLFLSLWKNNAIKISYYIDV